jgi:basic amino acid/polyamine antiporter, APA family
MDSLHSGQTLKRVLTWPSLMAIGIGGILGAGIFVSSGIIARNIAGPALCFSYLISGGACLITAAAYAELVSAFPSAGSAYIQARLIGGDIFGWFIAWEMVLEYAIGCAVVAQGWAGYLNSQLKLIGAAFPAAISDSPFGFDPSTGEVFVTGSAMNLPPMLITIAITAFLIRGIHLSSTLNNILVSIKVFILVFVILAGLPFISATNYSPFAPFGFWSWSLFGFPVLGGTNDHGESVGILAGASLTFFSFLGFDAIAANSEECQSPGRDLPIAMIGSVLSSLVLYLILSLVLCGMIPYSLIDPSAPLSSAFSYVGMSWAGAFVSLGAICGLTSVLVAALLGAPRVLFALSRDGYLPRSWFYHVHSEYQTPHRSSISLAVFVMLTSGFIPLTVLLELVSIGTLSTFATMNICVVLSRKRYPDISRPFRMPGNPVLPVVGASVCLLLMLALPATNWIRFIIWLAIGSLVYYFYGRHHIVHLNVNPYASLNDSSIELEPQNEPPAEVSQQQQAGSDLAEAEKSEDLHALLLTGD